VFFSFCFETSHLDFFPDSGGGAEEKKKEEEEGDEKKKKKKSVFYPERKPNICLSVHC